MNKELIGMIIGGLKPVATELGERLIQKGLELIERSLTGEAKDEEILEYLSELARGSNEKVS